MRDILFRGKRLDNAEWAYGNLFISDTDNGFHILCGSRIVTIEYEVDAITVGQYTGLLDKNGRRIFEGDVVTVKQNRSPGSATIFCDNGAFSVMPISGNILERTLWEYWYNDWDIEIIGNIHDNQKLLEGMT